MSTTATSVDGAVDVAPGVWARPTVPAITRMHPQLNARRTYRFMTEPSLPSHSKLPFRLVHATRSGAKIVRMIKQLACQFPVPPAMKSQIQSLNIDEVAT